MATAPSLLAAYLAGYPAPLVDQAQRLFSQGAAGDYLSRAYPQPHQVRSDPALYAHAQALKRRFLRHAPPLAKVGFDHRLQSHQQALGTLTHASRVQGGRLQAKCELRVAALFKDAPAAMLDMIVVHELAHLKEREHNKAFYALCGHMLPGYHQIEFDTRLYLAWRSLPELSPASPRGG